MPYKLLFIWVEGDDDKRFFDKILLLKFQEKYDTVKVIKYAEMKRGKVDNFIKSIKAMGADYIYLTDINDSPCITAKKKEIQSKYKNIDNDKMIVVVKEIEGWYLAGLDNKVCKQFKIDSFANTDNVTKEKFNALIPKKFTSRVDFISEILKNFSIEIAKQKNNSFQYFAKKYDC
ncbi:MAG: hypothetical protein DRP84_12435 [Spirochaetes bacterium]|nr:MAG: hypothetical protein CW713_07665 [Methanophagales archaeon]RKX90899.1 MAG: hypothetical protein DRP84_12435 [Spirochaetota bacterium]